MKLHINRDMMTSLLTRTKFVQHSPIMAEKNDGQNKGPVRGILKKGGGKAKKGVGITVPQDGYVQSSVLFNIPPPSN